MSTNTYSTLASLPAASSNTGNIALVTSNGVQYISDGQKWKSQGEFTTGTIESLQLDDLSFNGSFTNFALKVGGNNVFPQNTTDVIIVVNGNTLKPGRDYNFIKSASFTSISFTNSDNTPKAYPAGTIFYGLVFSRLPLDSNNALQKSGGTMVGDITFSSNQSFPSSGIDNASTTQSGIVSLSSSTGSTSESVAATSKAVKDTKDVADAALPKAGGTMTGDITFNSTQQFDGRDVSADGTKLDGIAASANNYSISSDLLDEDNMASNSATKVASQQSIKAYVDAHTGATDLSYTASSRELASSTGTNVTLPEATTSAAGLQSSADKTKLDGIETAATADQTASEIKTAYESNSDTNAFTDADHTKLDGIETSATADQTGAEIKSAYEGEADTNAFTDADHTKLDGIATGAEVNVNADWNSTSGDSQILNKPTLVSALNDLSDVSAASPSANQIIKWNGSAWALAADGGGSGGGGVSQNLIVTLTESIDGSRTDFTMSTTPATAQNLMVSINGVIQKPNAGTTISNSSEGYCVSGNTLKFATAPANGSTVFVVAQTAAAGGGSTNLSFTGAGSNVSTSFDNDAWAKIVFDGSYSATANGPNKIIIQNDTTGAGWYAGFGISSNEFGYYSGGNHVFYTDKTNTNQETGLKIIEHGAVELYYDNGKKLETIAGGVSITGELNVTTKVAYPDNGKAIFGTGDDLQIYHDGSHSRIVDSGTGDLVLQGSDTYLNSANNSEHKAIFYDNGGVALYYDNAKKAETTAHGLFITGSLWADGIYLDDNEKIHLGTSGQDLDIYHDGTNSYINDLGTGALRIVSSTVLIRNAADNENCLVAHQNGDVQLYYDGSEKLRTLSTGTRVSGDIQLPFVDANNGLRNKISWTSQADYFDEVAYIAAERTALSGATSDLVFANGSVNAVSEKMRIDSSGRVMIGVTSTTHAHGDSDDLCVGNNDSSSSHGITIGSNVNGSIRFADSASGGAGRLEYMHGSANLFKMHGNTTASTTGVLGLVKTNAATNAQVTMITFEAGSQARGQIKSSSSDSGTPSFAAYSDYRIKENIRDYTGGWNNIKAVPVKLFDITTDGSKDQKGWIAHELQAVLPDLVQGTKDAVVTQAMVDNEENDEKELGNPIYQTVSMGLFMPDVISALQTAIAKIETLETKIAALETK